MYRYLLVVLLMLICSSAVMAQSPDTTTNTKKTSTDTLVSTKQDTDVIQSRIPKVKKERVYHPDSLHSPRTAIIRSLIIPGWGQLYNHQWWKVPIIYGGLGLIGAAIVFNANNYKEFLTLTKYRYRGIVPQPTDAYYNEYNLYTSVSDQAIYDAKDGYRRNRDLSYLGLAAAWGINVIDAYIDAKFQNAYTVDNNLSMNIKPTLLNQPVFALNASTSYIPGIKITFTLR